MQLADSDDRRRGGHGDDRPPKAEEANIRVEMEREDFASVASCVDTVDKTMEIRS